jgi:hypothetical protein
VVASWDPPPESPESAASAVPPPESDSVVESDIEPDVADDDPGEVDSEGAGPDETELSPDRWA